MLIGGISFAVWKYSFTGGLNSLSTAETELEFLESNNKIISLTNAAPMLDETGKTGGEKFDFQVRTKAPYDTSISYDLILEKLEVDSGKTALKNNEVKVYIEDFQGNVVLAPTKLSELNNYKLVSKTNNHSSTNKEIINKYRLRVWLDKDVDIFDNQNKQIKFRININKYPEKTDQNQIVLTYDSNGGEGCTKTTVTYNEAYGSLCTPTRENYDFLGWYTAKDGGTKVTSTTKATYDHIYAHWNLNAVKIDVLVNNGKVSGESSKTVQLNTNVTFNINTNEGYNTPVVTCTNDQTGTISNNTLTVLNVTKDTTCTVTHSANTYQVRYNANGGTLQTSPTMTSTGDNPWEEVDGVYRSGNYNIASSTSTLTSEEFTLAETTTLSFEWAVSSESASYDYLYYTIYKDGSALSDTGTSTKIGGNYSVTDEANLTYTTVEKELTAGTYTIEFTYKKDSSADKGLDRGYVKNISISGINMDNSTFTYDVEDNLKSNKFVKEGYTFQGWSTSSSGGTVNYQNGATIKNLTSENNKIIDLYAVWKINSYDVNVIVQNGTVDTGAKKVEHGQNTTFNLTPEVSGSLATVMCTNNQTGSITNNVLTLSNVTRNTTCTVKYVTEMITLYTDGTLIINENLANRSSNITNHGAVTNEYDALSSSNSYVMSGYYSQPWANERDNITSIEIGSEIHPTSTANWFHSLRNVSYGDFTNLKTENVTNMSSMFSSLGYNSNSTTFELIGLDNWDTSNVTNMISMFGKFYLNSGSSSYGVGYSATTWSIGDLSGWDTSSVTNMSWMFSSAGYSATTFNIGDLSGWDTSSVTNMYGMFHAAGSSATTFNIGNLSRWNISNVTDMGSMFSNAGKKATNSVLNITNWNPTSVTETSYMFNGAGFKTIYCNNDWNSLSNITDSTNMFSDATNLVGGNGTTYNSSYVDKTYARPDTSSTPGYFTTTKYTITLNGNGATTNGTTSVTATYNSSSISPSTITIPKRTVTVSGFETSSSRDSDGAIISSTEPLTTNNIFQGWYTATSGGSKVISNSTTPTYEASVSGYTDANSKWIKAGSATLYAQWSLTEVTLPTITTTKSGYGCGWTTSSTGTIVEYDSGEKFKPSANTTLYAICVSLSDSCFTEDTLISSLYNKKKISDIKVGDIVKSNNNGIVEYKKVTKVFERRTNEIYIVKVDDEIIETTKEHPFYVKGKGYVKASELNKNDQLLNTGGNKGLVKDVTRKFYRDGIYVYNFEVEDNHNYYVSNNSYLVHNTCNYNDMILD